jgi:serine/threonine protein kinase
MRGRYLVTRRLGKGASATVYEAESLNISRQFAIKVIDLGACNGDKDPELIRARLDREIEAISRLQNPHTVPFYEVITLSESCVGIVMKFINGQTLDGVIACEAPMDWRRATRLLRQLASGVHEAHEAGLIHRDLKPANIMVEQLTSGDEFVHVLDFGIVWIDDGLEVTRGFVGTPLYASPEQALGERIDRRSDIYALGAIFFELLTGRPPFQSKNVIEVLRMHVGHTPPTLADALEQDGRGARRPRANTSRADEQAAFPHAVQNLVERMLSKSREARPFDLTEVIGALDDLLLDDSGTPGERRSFAGERAGHPARGEIARTADGLGVLETMRGERANAVTVDACSESQIEEDRRIDDELDGFFDRPETGMESLGDQNSLFESDERDDTGPKAAIFRPRATDHHRAAPPRAP